MPRGARVVPPGCPLHVTQRGNRRQPVFFDRDGYLRYLHLLQEEAERHAVQVWAYCLMPNHVHLIVAAHTPHTLSHAMRQAHGRYAQWTNARQGWSGHLWAQRFFSTPMDARHLWAAVRYVELNPVRAGLAQRAEDYPWSSARVHAGQGVDPLLDPDRPFPGDIPDWTAWLQEGLEEDEANMIRSRTRAGLPLGETSFVAALEQELGRPLAGPVRGRPPEIPR
jgi:putative transposase